MEQKTPNTIVKEIHNSFSSAEQELVEEAKKVLEKAEDEDRVERSKKLASMGFGNAEPVKELSEERIRRAENLQFMKERYKRIAPQYKFITHEKVIEICDKYDIVIGPSTRYTGDIPEENQQDILNFTIADESFLEAIDEEVQDFTWDSSKQLDMKPSEMSTNHLVNSIKMLSRKLSGYTSNTGEKFRAIRAFVYELSTRGEQTEIDLCREYFQDKAGLAGTEDKVNKLFSTDMMTHFYVAADVGSFDQEGMVIEGVELKSEETSSKTVEDLEREWFQHYDPIVLAKVDAGYLIVTAWGVEASDPDVHNEKLN